VEIETLGTVEPLSAVKVGQFALMNVGDKPGVAIACRWGEPPEAHFAIFSALPGTGSDGIRLRRSVSLSGQALVILHTRLVPSARPSDMSFLEPDPVTPGTLVITGAEAWIRLPHRSGPLYLNVSSGAVALGIGADTSERVWIHAWKILCERREGPVTLFEFSQENR
jgi:hypothetical protein